jgi:hypothetical protein
LSKEDHFQAAGPRTLTTPEDDGTLPEFENSEREGPLPVVVRGRLTEHIAELPADESGDAAAPQGAGGST